MGVVFKVTVRSPSKAAERTVTPKVKLVTA